jgi:predicted phosphodiesterase
LDRPNITLHGNFAELTFDSLKIYLQHYPRSAEIAANSGLFDVCICGHDHIYNESVVKDCLVLNPGTIHGYKHIEKIDATFMVFDTATKTAQKLVLD